MSSDGEEFVGVRPSDDGPSCDVGGYRLAARRTDAWDAIVEVLIALDAEHQDYFHDTMRRCRRLSNSTPEIDGLHDLLFDGEQEMFDVALDREGRRERQGYVTAAQARAFLHVSRALRLGRNGTVPLPNPVARAYFEPVESARAMDTSNGRQGLLAASGTPPAGDTGDAGVAAFVDVLRDAGVLEPQPRALLEGQEENPRHARMRAHMQFARAHDPGAYSVRTAELAYLANALISGCSIQARPFTPHEASDAAVAVCNLGLENWLAGLALPDDFLVGHDVIGVFQVGWTVLHDDVSMYAADQLIAILTDLRCDDDREIQSGLDALRVEMTRYLRVGAPWRAREALDVIAILDMPAWAALLGLIDECPVIHAAMRTSLHARTRAVSATAIEFISENSQIASVHEFIDRLPETLRH